LARREQADDTAANDEDVAHGCSCRYKVWDRTPDPNRSGLGRRPKPGVIGV
jgi:hypothetical protein